MAGRHWLSGSSILQCPERFSSQSVGLKPVTWPLWRGEGFSSMPRCRGSSPASEGSPAAQESRIPECDLPWHLAWDESARLKYTVSRAPSRPRPAEQAWEASIRHPPEPVVKRALLNAISTFKETKRLLLRRGINCIARQGVGVEGRPMGLRGEKLKSWAWLSRQCLDWGCCWNRKKREDVKNGEIPKRDLG